MHSPSTPGYLHTFHENWAAVLHKIYPDKTRHAVRPDTAPTDFNVVILQISQQYAAIVEHFSRTDVKDNDRADHFRQQATQMWNDTGFGGMDVAEVLNRSLAYAEAGRSALYRGYELRSVICYNLEEFRLCMGNIENGLGCGEGRNLYKILKLKNFCMRQINNDTNLDVPIEATLSYEGNPVIPHVVTGIELGVCEVYGRHLVATRNFDFGDILMIDEPYVVVADLVHQYRQCHHCLKFCILKLIPCPGCVEVMFCSSKCAKIAQQQYHRFECPILLGLYTIDKIGRMAMIVARIIFTAITTFNDDLDALRGHLSGIDKNLHPFKLNWTTITAEQRYEAIYSLATNKGIRDSETNNSFSIVSIFIAEIMLLKSPLMKALANTKPKVEFIRNLVYHHAITAGTNMRIVNRDNSLGAYPMVSMINHGSVPNVMRVSLPEGRVAVVATRPIASGEQILEDYTFAFRSILTEVTHSERHHFLHWAYQIDGCQCTIPIADEAFQIWEEEIVRALDGLASIEMKQCNRDDLQVLMKRFPSWMRMLKPWFVGADKVREGFVQMAHNLFEAVFNERPEEERYEKKGLSFENL